MWTITRLKNLSGCVWRTALLVLNLVGELSDRCLLFLKHPIKSVLFKPLSSSVNETQNIISQYRLTYTLYSGLNHVNYLNIIKRSCVGNRTDTSALSEWMVVRPFRSLVQLRGSPNASGLQTHDLFL